MFHTFDFPKVTLSRVFLPFKKHVIIIQKMRMTMYCTCTILYMFFDPTKLVDWPTILQSVAGKDAKSIRGNGKKHERRYFKLYLFYSTLHPLWVFVWMGICFLLVSMDSLTRLGRAIGETRGRI